MRQQVEGSPCSSARAHHPSLRLTVTSTLSPQAVASHPLVVFMKGTPEQPQCGFSRAVIQILGVHDVPPAKMKTYNCLEDQELREGIKEYR